MDAPTHVAYACIIVQGRADRYQLWTRACPCRECRTGLAQQRCQARLLVLSLASVSTIGTEGVPWRWGSSRGRHARRGRGRGKVLVPGRCPSHSRTLHGMHGLKNVA